MPTSAIRPVCADDRTILRLLIRMGPVHGAELNRNSTRLNDRRTYRSLRYLKQEGYIIPWKVWVNGTVQKGFKITDLGRELVRRKPTKMTTTETTEKPLETELLQALSEQTEPRNLVPMALEYDVLADATRNQLTFAMTCLVSKGLVDIDREERNFRYSISSKGQLLLKDDEEEIIEYLLRTHGPMHGTKMVSIDPRLPRTVHVLLRDMARRGRIVGRAGPGKSVVYRVPEA